MQEPGTVFQRSCTFPPFCSEMSHSVSHLVSFHPWCGPISQLSLHLGTYRDRGAQSDDRVGLLCLAAPPGRECSPQWRHLSVKSFALGSIPSSLTARSRQWARSLTLTRTHTNPNVKLAFRRSARFSPSMKMPKYM